MPIHDWTRAGSGAFHDFHSAWIIELRNALNAGLLSPAYYAMAEQVAGDFIPDVLALQESAVGPGTADQEKPAGALAVLEAPPKVSLTESVELDRYALLNKELVIRHSSGDRIVALVEIVSSGNKSSAYAVKVFVEKALAAFSKGINVLVVDLYPPGPFDPHGIYGAIWSQIKNDAYRVPTGKPLTLSAYSASNDVTSYVEPAAVGSRLIDMRLFLKPGWYVNIPLETTYMAAFKGVPLRWRRVIEGS